MLATLFYNETTSNEKVKRNPIDFNENYTIPEDFDGYAFRILPIVERMLPVFRFTVHGPLFRVR